MAETIHGSAIDGPWDMAASDDGFIAQLFVTNVLHGTVAAGGAVVDRGTVVRLTLLTAFVSRPLVLEETTIGSGFRQRSDPAALILGPTGVGLGRDGTLYVADTLSSRIAAIPNAAFRTSSDGTGRTVSHGGALNQPLGLVIAPNGNILTVNGGNGNLVETTPWGTTSTR